MTTTIYGGAIGTAGYPSNYPSGGVADTTFRAQSWRQAYYELERNGDLPLLALTSKAKRQTISSKIHNWMIDVPMAQGGSFTKTEIYTTASLGTKLTGAVAAGAMMYIKVAESVASLIIPGKTLALRASDNSSVHTVVVVTAVTKNGASSFIAAKVLVADTSGTAASTKSDTIMVIGSSHPEFGAAPEGITYFPTPYQNYAQRFWTTMRISEEEKNAETILSEDEYKRRKMKAFKQHGQDMENALWLGRKAIYTATNGQSTYTMGGLFEYVSSNAPQNVFDYRYTNSTNGWTITGSGTTWATAGEAFMNHMLLTWSQYAPGGTPLMVGGAAALAGINTLAKAGSVQYVNPGAQAYGLNVHRFISAFGEFDFKVAPLWSHQATLKNSLAILVPGNVRVLPHKGLDTDWIKETNTPSSYEESGFRTVMTAEFGPAEQFIIAHGIGLSQI